jgi:hypothetical protein
VFEFLEEPRAYFVVMECVGGGELFDRIADKVGSALPGWWAS